MKITVPVMREEEVEINKCPFCGEDSPMLKNENDEYGSDDEDRFYIQCYCCEASGSRTDSEYKAVVAWNNVLRSN